MKAQDLVQATYDAEQELQVEIGGLIGKKVNELSEKTGLDIADVYISLTESTSYQDTCKNWLVSHVIIETRLPNKISLE